MSAEQDPAYLWQARFGAISRWDPRVWPVKRPVVSATNTNIAAATTDESAVPLRNPLWLSVWLLIVGIGIFGFLQVGMAALSH